MPHTQTFSSSVIRIRLDSFMDYLLHNIQVTQQLIECLELWKADLLTNWPTSNLYQYIKKPAYTYVYTQNQ